MAAAANENCVCDMMKEISKPDRTKDAENSKEVPDTMNPKIFTQANRVGLTIKDKWLEETYYSQKCNISVIRNMGPCALPDMYMPSALRPSGFRHTYQAKQSCLC